MVGGTHRHKNWSRGIASTALLAIALLAPASAQASLVTPQPVAAGKPIVPASAPSAAAPSVPQESSPPAGDQASSGQQSSGPEPGPLSDGIPDDTNDPAMTDLAPRLQNPFIQNPFVSPTVADLIDAIVWDAGEIDPSIYIRALRDGENGLYDPGLSDPGIFEPLLSDGTHGPGTTTCPKGETPQGRGTLCPN